MRVLHVIPSVSPKHGGPSFALPLITRALALHSVQTTVATTDDDGPGARLDVPLGRRVANEKWASEIVYFRKNTEFYKVSLGVRSWLRQHAREFDLIHVHALFSHASIAAAHAAQRARVPYVVRPLGVLNRWGMENRRRAIKAASLRWIELPALRKAAAIHFTSEAERDEAQEAAPEIRDIRSAVIPLPVEVHTGDARDFTSQYPQAHGRRVVLFLSRIAEKKGIELLLEAFRNQRRQNSDVLLMLAGEGDAEYVARLKQQATHLGIAEDVLWTGFLAGAAKADALAAATVFVLPSYSENFGIAAAEALAAGVPCILSNGVAIASEAAAAHAALVTNPEVSELTTALRTFLTDAGHRQQLAENAREFARRSYSLEAVGRQLSAFYESILLPQPDASRID